MASNANDNRGVFPLEIYEIIISYVPDRYSLSSVSKLFYEITCDIEEFKKKLRVERDGNSKLLNIMDDAVFKSMLNTKRSIDTVEIAGEIAFVVEYERLKLLFVLKMGETVTKIIWKYRELSPPKIMKILSLAPHLSRLYMPYESFTGGPKFDSEPLPPGFALRLESIEIEMKALLQKTNGKCFADYIVPRQLKELCLTIPDSYFYQNFKMFLKKQPNIEKLEFYGECGSLPQIISQNLVKLQHLDLKFFPVNDDDFNFICDNFTHLKTLGCQLKEVAPETLTRTADLKELRNLWIFDCSDISQARSDSVKSLQIQSQLYFQGALTPLNAEQLAVNFPALVKFNTESSTLQGFAKFLRHFKNLEEFETSGNAFHSTEFDREDQEILSKLKRLTIKSLCYDIGNFEKNLIEPQRILKLLKIAPSLEELHIDFALDPSTEQEMIKAVEVLKEVKAKVKKCSFEIESYNKVDLLVEKLRGVFKNIQCDNRRGKFLNCVCLD